MNNCTLINLTIIKILEEEIKTHLYSLISVKELYLLLKKTFGTSLAVQWLRFRTSTARGVGSIPGRGNKIPHVAWHGQKKKKIFQHFQDLLAFFYLFKERNSIRFAQTKRLEQD